MIVYSVTSLYNDWEAETEQEKLLGAQLSLSHFPADLRI